MSEITQEQVEQWRTAIGRQVVERQALDALSMRRYARAVGSNDDNPPLRHWAFFLPCPLDDEIGADGHPRRGEFLPPVSLPRRMFAAARIDFHAPLEIGREGQLTSVISDVTHKAGRSGDLVFVEVDRTLEQEGQVCVRERQSYVYRAAGERPGMPQPSDPTPEGEIWQPGEVNLFRFSAATFNAHRIHYDRPYATEIEGYPALVVHGPFTAARLAELAMRRGPLASFSFRALAPLFIGQPIYLCAIADDTFTAIRCDGITAMEAKVAYA
jgi:3-methylfumaryl-CoA hydratase